MAVKKKDYVPMSVKLRADVAKRLERYKESTGVNKTFVIEKAVEEYLDRVEKKVGENDD